MKTLDELDRIGSVLTGATLPRAKRPWGGADVVISLTPPPAQDPSAFYPAPRYVVTDFPLELSWLFESLRDAFYAEERVDSCSKIELFGRLANAANRYVSRNTTPNVHHLCAAVLHEAWAIYDEMEDNSFQYLHVAVGNEIADDYVDEAIRTGYVGTEETLSFLKSRGVEVPHD